MEEYVEVLFKKKSKSKVHYSGGDLMHIFT